METVHIVGYLLSLLSAGAIVMGIESLNGRISAAPVPVRRSAPLPLRRNSP